MEMDWAQDYCLACDRQTNGGVYCSQACRTADVDRSSCSGSEPVSPAFSGPQTSLPSSFVGYGSGFHLPPAIDFSIYKTSNSTTATRRTSSTTPNRQADPSTQRPQRSLTSSSSRTSLSSLQTSTSQTVSLSDQIRQELMTYAGSFDRVRDLKRRITSP